MRFFFIFSILPDLFFYGLLFVLLEKSRVLKSLKKSPELSFLIDLFQQKNLPETPSKIQLEALRSHRLEGWAYEKIPQWRNVLKDQKLFWMQKSMSQLAALIKIKKAFEAENIEFIVLKGLPLSMLLYGDYTVRNSGDVDIFIRPADLVKAHESLLHQGYSLRINHPVSDNLLPVLLSAEKDLGYLNSSRTEVIECHWRLMRNPNFLSDSFDEFLAKAQQVIIGGISYNFFSNEDLLIYLCMHAANHHWEMLSWLMDIHSLIEKMEEQSQGSVNWALLVERAKEQNVLNALLIAFLWREIFFGTFMPLAIRNLCGTFSLNCLLEFESFYLRKKWWAHVGLISDVFRFSLFPTFKDKCSFYHIRAFSHYRQVLRWHLPFPKLCLTLCYFLEPFIIAGRLFKYSGQALVRVFRRLISI